MTLEIKLDDFDIEDVNGAESIKIDIDEYIEEILDSDEYFQEVEDKYDGWFDEQIDDVLREADTDELIDILEDKGYVCIDIDNYRGELDEDDTDYVRRKLDYMSRMKKHDFFCDMLGLSHLATTNDITEAIKETLA